MKISQIELHLIRVPFEIGLPSGSSSKGGDAEGISDAAPSAH